MVGIEGEKNPCKRPGARYCLGSSLAPKKEETLSRKGKTYIGNKTPGTVFCEYAYVRGVLPTSLWHLEEEVLQTGTLRNYPIM